MYFLMIVIGTMTPDGILRAIREGLGNVGMVITMPRGEQDRQYIQTFYYSSDLFEKVKLH